MRTTPLAAALLLLACTGRNPSEIASPDAMPDALADAVIEEDAPDAEPMLDDAAPPVRRHDADGDGVPDEADNCPYDDNPGQRGVEALVGGEEAGVVGLDGLELRERHTSPVALCAPSC